MVTPAGEVWADLNAAGSYKFSDADFPAILNWSCIADDTSTEDQRCDSAKLKALILSDITDPAERQRLLQNKDPMQMFALTQRKSIEQKLRRAICKFPSEFDQGTFESRYGHIQQEEYFQENPKNWDKLKAHIKALTLTDLPPEYKAAQWHLQPLEFIAQMRKCGWLSKGELVQCLPSHQVRTGKWKDAHGTKHDGVFWEGVAGPEQNGRVAEQLRTNLSNHSIPLNKAMRKYGINTPLRMASFLGNAMQETTWLSALSEGSPNGSWYAPWYGRGFLQLTHAENYIYYWLWRGRSISASLLTALIAAAKQAHSSNSNAGLQDSHFAGVTQQIKDWRADVGAALDSPRANSGDALVAPSDSAGFYAAQKGILKCANESHTLERVSVAVVDSHGTAQGSKVYYRSPAFWQVSAAVNLPGAISRTNYHGINGFDSRCSAYGVALAVLTEMRFPDANGALTVFYPEGYTKRGMK